MNEKRQDARYTSAGVWCLISHMNHSCISNTSRSFIGDMQIVRATRDIEDGSELFTCYMLSYDLDSYEKAQDRLRRWGFTCHCALCLDRNVTPKRVRTQRESLLLNFAKLMMEDRTRPDIPNAQKTLEILEQTYSPTAIRREASIPYFALGAALLTMDKPSEAIEMTLKGLEALGFVISASPPRRRPKSSKPRLRIKQWGMAVAYSANAFLILHRAYKKVAPELKLSVVARDYLVVAYTMNLGEKTTIRDSIPDLTAIDPSFSV